MPTATSPNALCFGPDLPGSGTPCCVEICEAGLSLQFFEGAPPSTIAFSSLTVGAGGFDHDQLIMKWSEETVERTLYIKDAATIAAFRQTAPPELTAQLNQAAQSVRSTRTSRRAVILASVGTVLAIVLGLWFGSDLLVEQAVARIPIEWEQQLGESALHEALAGRTVLTEGPAVEAVQEITKRLTEQIPNSPYQFQVRVVKEPVVNAFALPGGYVVVFTGLLKDAMSPEEVAGVLGHEINHVLQRHGMERIVKTLGVMAVAAIVLGDQQGLIGLAKQLGVEIITLKYNRDQETEADLTGLRLLHKAKIEPEGMITFFERLAQSEKEKSRVEMLSTHPMSTHRAERLRAELKTLPKLLPEPFTFDWEKVQTGLEAGGTAAKP